MIVSALGLALVLLQTPPAPAAAAVQAVPANLSATFVKILRKVPAFLPATGRAIQTDLKGVATPQAPFPLWVVEFRWTEKGAANSGLAMFVEMAGIVKVQPAAEKEVSVREDGWGLGTLTEGKTLAAWLEEMNAVRRAANEAAALADVRTVLSAQRVFQYASGGSYGELSCLGEPASCLPGSKEKSILDVPFTAAPERGGYRRAFHAGPATKGAKSPKLLNTFAFTAVPMSPDSGKLGFCGDSTGAVCAVSGEPMPAIVGGACPKACVPLQ